MNEGKLTLYRGCTPVVDTRYEKDSGKSPAETIIDALAAAEGVDATDLPPLYETIDPDALDQLFEDHEGAAGAEATLSFRFDTWNVFVRADGRIRVCDATRRTEPAPVFENNPA